MKSYIIRETSGYPFITRNGQIVTLGLNDQFTEDELPSLMCDKPTTYISVPEGVIYTLAPTGITVLPTIVDPIIITPVVEETPATGVVPSNMETGSEASTT
jgi:hypothetical protein